VESDRIVAFSGDKGREHELFLSSARTAVGPSEELRIRRLIRKPFDWSYFVSTARRHGVIPLCYRTLRDLEEADIPADVLGSLRKAFHQWGLWVHARITELRSLVETFEAEGISVIPFKGPVLGERAYGDAALRKPGDLDLLVPRHDFSRTRELLIEAGYEPKIPAEKESAYLERRQGFPFYGERCNVDLHWTLEQPLFENFPLSFKIKPDQIWSDRRSISFAGTSVNVLSDEHLLLYLSAHGAKHSWSWLYHICDIAELVGRRDIDWDKIQSLARELRMERLLGVGLLLAHELLDAGLPADVEDRFCEDSAVHRLVDLFSSRLFDVPNGHRTIEHTITRLRLLNSFRDRAAYLWSRGLRTILAQ
jgi:hypothetical protein